MSTSRPLGELQYGYLMVEMQTFSHGIPFHPVNEENSSNGLNCRIIIIALYFCLLAKSKPLHRATQDS